MGIAVVAASALVHGCGGNSKAAGSVGGPCLANSTCNTGLVCLSQLCVEPNGGGGTGVGGNGTGGGAAGNQGAGGAGNAGLGGTGAGGRDTDSGGATSSTGGTGVGGMVAASGGITVPVGGNSGAGGSGGNGGNGGTGLGGIGTGGAGTGGLAGRGAGGAGGGGIGGAGTGGLDGTGAGGQPMTCADVAMIDDMESGTGYICGNSGRVGRWFTYADSASSVWPGTQTIPAPPSSLATPRGNSMRAMHSYGNFVQFAGMGCFMKVTPDTFDGSAYNGLQFYAMGTASDLKVIVQTSATESTMFGGSCALVPYTSCGGNEAPVPGLTQSAWTLVTVPFVSLAGGTAVFNRADIWSVEFQSGVGAFDYWIDDLSFY